MLLSPVMVIISLANVNGDFKNEKDLKNEKSSDLSVFVTSYYGTRYHIVSILSRRYLHCMLSV